MSAGRAPIAGALVSPRKESALTLVWLGLPPAGTSEGVLPHLDQLLFIQDGHGTLELEGQSHDLTAGSAALVLAGESAALTSQDGLRTVVATVSEAAERHAPLGDRAVTVSEERAESGRATGSRSFQILFGPHNGCERATLFLGYVPHGRAPWHYHFYDEIVLIRRGLARVHRADGTTEDVTAGAAFRLAPREVHIVENAGDEELALLGLFTPAGSPSAAYLPDEAPAAQP